MSSKAGSREGALKRLYVFQKNEKEAGLKSRGGKTEERSSICIESGFLGAGNVALDGSGNLCRCSVKGGVIVR